MGLQEAYVWIVSMARPTYWNPQAWAPGRVLQRRRSGQAALTSGALRKAPSLLADSVRKTPPLSHPLLSLFPSPAA